MTKWKEGKRRWWEGVGTGTLASSGTDNIHNVPPSPRRNDPPSPGRRAMVKDAKSAPSYRWRGGWLILFLMIYILVTYQQHQYAFIKSSTTGTSSIIDGIERRGHHIGNVHVPPLGREGGYSTIEQGDKPNQQKTVADSFSLDGSIQSSFVNYSISRRMTNEAKNEKTKTELPRNTIIASRQILSSSSLSSSSSSQGNFHLSKNETHGAGSTNNNKQRGEHNNNNDSTTVKVKPQQENKATVLVRASESFFWRGRQAKFCQRIKSEMKAQQQRRRQQHEIGSVVDGDDDVVPKRLKFRLEAPCTNIHKEQRHGNYILGLYGMHLAVLAYEVDFEFSCGHHGKVPSSQNLFTWLQTTVQQNLTTTLSDVIGTNQNVIWQQLVASSQDSSISHKNNNHTNSLTSVNRVSYDPVLPTLKLACKGMGTAPLHYISDKAREDLRRMSLQLLQSKLKQPSLMRNVMTSINLDETKQSVLSSTTTTTSPSPLILSTFPPELRPLLVNSKVQWDEVAIHFRCGDILSNFGSQDTNYGFIKYSAYRTRIHPNVTSIGIITAPFDNPTKLRWEDAAYHKGCQRIVTDFASYLNENFNNATITIRNDPNEGIPIVYSRMVLAQQTFCIRSTFCLFPALASFGQSYFQDGGVAYFIPPTEKVYDNVHLMNASHITSQRIAKLGIDGTISWLRD